MKFRDPKTGEVYEGIERARTGYCSGKDCDHDCEIAFKRTTCSRWARDHLTEAAHLMGLEVITGEEEPVDKKDKPRICEVLGVEVGEVFSVRMDNGEVRRFMAHGIRLHHVREDGSMGNRANAMSLWLLEHPDRIIRKPRFTEEEVAKAAHLHGAWGENARLRRTSSNTLTLEQGEGLWLLPNEWFPSLRPGQAIPLDHIIREGCHGADHP